MSDVFGPEESGAEEIADAEVLSDETSLSPDESEEREEASLDHSGVDDVELSASEIVAIERDEYLDALRRLQAEFDNYRKRTARQHTELLERATESLIERLLPVLDALDLAVAHAAADGTEADGVGAALVQIGTMMRDILVREGLERIDATEVEFDPTMHDAVAHVPANEGDEPGGVNLIDDVLRPGYRLRDRVLRPAMVRVRG